jgi:hypothetical protein
VTVPSGLRLPHCRLVSFVVAAASVYMSTFMLLTGGFVLVGWGDGVGTMVPSEVNWAFVLSNAAVTAVSMMATAASAMSGIKSFLLKFVCYFLKQEVNITS